MIQLPTNSITLDVPGCSPNGYWLHPRTKNGFASSGTNSIGNFGENMVNIKSALVTQNNVFVHMKVELSKVLNFIGKLPSEAIFFGMAKDGLPVLWNVKNEEPNNIVIWDKLHRQGLRLLKCIAEYVFVHKQDDKVEFVVLTNSVEDWGELNRYGMGMTGNTSCIGIIPFNSELAHTVLLGLCQWINESHKSSKAPVIVLIDGMETLDKMNMDFRTNFRYLLTSGHKKNVYVIGTASKRHFAQVQDWLDGFHFEINGRNIEEFFEIIEDNENIVFYVPVTETI